jgi:hypothetical protein
MLFTIILTEKPDYPEGNGVLPICIYELSAPIQEGLKEKFMQLSL